MIHEPKQPDENVGGTAPALGTATERVAFWLNGAADDDLIELEARELRALLAEHAAEVETLRAERTPRKVVCPVCQRPTKLTATGLIRYHGPHNRPCKGSSILPEVES